MAFCYGGICSGIEAAIRAWHPLDLRASRCSVIEPFPSAALAHHYPDVPNQGNVAKLATMARAKAAKDVVGSVAAKNLGMHINRVTLIAQENGFRYAEKP